MDAVGFVGGDDGDVDEFHLRKFVRPVDVLVVLHDRNRDAGREGIPHEIFLQRRTVSISDRSKSTEKIAIKLIPSQ